MRFISQAHVASAPIFKRKWIYTTFQHATPCVIATFLLFGNTFRKFYEPCILGLRQASTPRTPAVTADKKNEVPYQKTSLPMRMLKVTLTSYKVLLKRCKISSILKQTGDALAPVLLGEKAHVLQTLKRSQCA